MATLDILTVAEGIRAALGVDTGHEDDVARMVTAVSGRIDELVGPVVNRTVTEYHHGGSYDIWPRQTPLSAVTTLKHADGATITTYTEDTWGSAGNADGFLVEQSGSYPHDARIHARSGGTNVAWLAGHSSLELVYVAGRAADTAAVAERYKEVAIECMRRLWDREASAWARGSDPFVEGGGQSSRFFKVFDYVVAEHLGDEMKPPGIG